MAENSSIIDEQYKSDFDRISDAGDTDRIGDLTTTYDKLLTESAEASEDMMAGKISDAMAEDIFTRSAERGLTIGLGSKAQFTENLMTKGLFEGEQEMREKGIAYAQETATIIQAGLKYEDDYNVQINQLLQGERSLDITEDQFTKSQTLAVNTLQAQLTENMYSLLGNWSINGVTTELQTQLSTDINQIRKDLGETLIG